MPIENYQHTDTWDVLYRGQELDNAQMAELGRDLLLKQSKLGHFLARFIPDFLTKMLTPGVICRRIAASFIEKQNFEVVQQHFHIAEKNDVVQRLYVLREQGWQLDRQIVHFEEEKLVIGPDTPAKQELSEEEEELAQAMALSLEKEPGLSKEEELQWTMPSPPAREPERPEEEELAQAMALSLARESEQSTEGEETELAMALSLVDEAQNIPIHEFAEKVCIDNQLVIREAVDNGNCLFDSCIDGPDRDPETLRELVYDWMSAHLGEYHGDIAISLRDDVSVLTDPRLSVHEREQMLAKLPDNLKKMYRQLTAERAENQAMFEKSLDDWLENTAVNDYITGMRQSRAYPDTLECRAIAEILDRPIRIHSPLWVRADGGDGFFDIVPFGGTHGQPDTYIHLLFDPNRKHYDRFEKADT